MVCGFCEICSRRRKRTEKQILQKLFNLALCHIKQSCPLQVRLSHAPLCTGSFWFGKVVHMLWDSCATSSGHISAISAVHSLSWKGKPKWPWTHLASPLPHLIRPEVDSWTATSDSVSWFWFKLQITSYNQWLWTTATSPCLVRAEVGINENSRHIQPNPLESKVIIRGSQKSMRRRKEKCF